MCIPTTAGTGSEATHFAVIYVDGKKKSIASQQLLPDVVILDPQLTDNMPAYVSACSGFDALSQAIESYWSRAATPLSQLYAAMAIEVLLVELPQAVNSNSRLARDKMQMAANWAGKAINISKTTAPHAMSYVITQEFGIPHGHAVALTLGKFFTLHEKYCNVNIGAFLAGQSLDQITVDLYVLLGVNNANEACHKWYEIMSICGLETSIFTFIFFLFSYLLLPTIATFILLLDYNVLFY